MRLNNHSHAPVYLRMAGVFETYEQQFATITADITARIGKIPDLVGSKLIFKPV